MTSPLTRTKPMAQILEEAEAHQGGLKKCLSALDLTALGVGAIIGTGIFVLTGVAAATQAGPAIMLSFVFAGLACIFAALCYAEFAARLPIAGSAYTYAYASIGELFAWIIGWDLVLEYSIGSAAVAVGWSGYLSRFLEGFGLHIPAELTKLPLGEATMNPLAGFIILVMTTLLAIGVKESARFNSVVVAIKTLVVLFVIFVGAQWVKPANWEPFFPFGINGVFAGAAYIFFAYIGFDAVSTTAEETKNPQRDLPIGIIASLLVCTVLYIAVAAVITGMVPYAQIDHTAPLAAAFGANGLAWAEKIVSMGAVAGLTSVLLVLLMSQPRIYFAMSRDGLFFPWFKNIHTRFGTPFNATLITGGLVAFMATFLPIDELAEMANIGTLLAFVIVCASILLLRHKSPENPSGGAIWVGTLIGSLTLMELAVLHQWPTLVAIASGAVVVGSGIMIARQKCVNAPTSFRCPWVPVIPILGIAGNIYMMLNLTGLTWTRLWVWLAIGLVIYFVYGIRNSNLAKQIAG